MPNIKNIAGNRYGCWLATENYRISEHGIIWECICDCGTIRYVLKKNLVNFNSKSCGCLISRPDYVRDRKLYGIGVVSGGKYKTVDAQGKHTKEYKLWSGMIERCYSPKNNEKQPTYAGCTVSENFKNFQYFAEWCNNQVGFGNKGWQLDKDILVKGNRVYSEDTCCFVPREINVLFTKRQNFRGKYPIGVSEYNGKTKFRASVNIDGKTKSLGNFSNVTEAFCWYKSEKEKEIKRKANKFINELSSKVYECLMTWEVSIDD